MNLTTSPSLAIVSTFPPTACGLATFAAALAGGLSRNGVTDIGVVRCAVDSLPVRDDRVITTLEPGRVHSIKESAIALNSYDCVLLQHEFGIFGGHDGDDVVRLIDHLEVPLVTTLHTIPTRPTSHQRETLERVIAGSDQVVTMTGAARQRLLEFYDVDPRDVVTIPHGATLPPPVAPRPAPFPTVLTWGLLGPGKGIEWVIDALAEVSDVVPQITYLVAGRTHPKVKEREGERYRESLKERARERGVEARVVFDQLYRDVPELIELVRSSSVVVLPYDSDDQVTSGVLVDAVAAGVPVVATDFPHARELLSDGAGIVVPHRDPSAIARALRTIVTNANIARDMRRRAEELARLHDWTKVAGDYLRLVPSFGRLSNPAVAS
jgi:glycosyltransferase involved in cell wall biosynthesis